MENIIKTYPCGLRLIVRNMPNFKSVATSVHVGIGSCNELDNEHGLSHFVEHMLFKGTKTRTGEQIAQTLSSLGVEYNAYTGNSATCYYTKGLASNVDICNNILSDMFFNLQFDEEEFKREAEVIIQEIAMWDDNPRHVLGELAAQTFFDNTPYGHNIAGTNQSVRSFKPCDIHNYIKKHYTAPNTIISFAGDITLAKAEALVKKYWLPNFNGQAKPNTRVYDTTTPSQNFVKRKKVTEQHNVAILFPTVHNNHLDKYALTYINDILSSDMSSRLFLSVREKLGLVYTISGGQYLTNIGGYYYIRFSCTPANTELCIKTIATELANFKKNGATDEEIQKVKNIKRAQRLFEAENVEAVNQRNVTQLAELNAIETTEEYLQKISKVTAKDIKAAAEKYLNYDNAIVAIVGQGIKVKPFELLSK